MELTVTFHGDATPEIAKMLQALGVALQGEIKAFSGINPAPVQTVDPVEETPVKKTRARKMKVLEPETEVEKPNIHEATDEELREKGIMKKVSDPEPEKEESEPETTSLSLENLREKGMEILKAGKKAAFQKMLDEFGLKSLSEAKKDDYEAINAKMAEL